MQVAAIVNVTESLQGHLRSCQGKNMPRVENTVGVEFYPLRPDWHRQEQPPVRLDHSDQVCERLTVTLRIDRIAVAAQPEVLKGMQAGHRIAARNELGRERLDEVALLKLDIPGRGRQWPDIENFNRPEGGDVGNKSVDAGADVDVPAWFKLVNAPGYEQILMEIPASRVAGQSERS